MRAGTLRNRVKFYRSKKVRDGDWGNKIEWEEFATVWAEVTATGGAERVEGRGVEGSTAYTIRMRYADGISTENRASVDGRMLDILTAIDPTNLKRELVITAVEHAEAEAVTQ